MNERHDSKNLIEVESEESQAKQRMRRESLRLRPSKTHEAEQNRTMSSSESDKLLRRERDREHERERDGESFNPIKKQQEKVGFASGKLPTVSSVSEAIESIGFGWFQIRLILSFGLITVADGGEMLMISLVNNVLPSEWGVTSMEKGFLGSIIFVGVLIGSTVIGPLADTFGRRICVLVPVMGVGVFGVLSALAASYAQLLALRCCVGTCIGCREF